MKTILILGADEKLCRHLAIQSVWEVDAVRRNVEGS